MAANLPLFVGTVLLAIAEIFLLCFSGYILARMDILNKQTRNQVNRVNTALLTPALLFSKIAFSLTTSELKELWIIPVLFIIMTSVSGGAAYIMALICRVKPAHRNFAMAAAMFMNLLAMPVPLMQSLIGTVGELKWTEDDTQDDMDARLLTYLFLYSTLGNIARWSFGVKLLEKGDDGPSEDIVEGKNIDIESNPPAVNSGELPYYGRSPSDATATGDLDRLTGSSRNIPSKFYISEEPVRFGEILRGASSTALQPVETRMPLSTKSSSATLAPHMISTALAGKMDPEPGFPPKLATSFQRFLHALKRLWFGFNALMTMPLWAALISIIVVIIPPLQNLISNHMPPLRNALESAGGCSIPVTLVVLGGYFFTPPPNGYVAPPIKERLRNAISFRRSKTPGALQEESRKRPGEKRTIAIAVISRQVLCPAILLPLMLVFVRFDVPKVFADPVFVVSNVLLISAPVALTLAQMSTANGASDTFERLLSKTIFYAYCVVLTPVTVVCVVIGLMLAKF